MFSTAFLAATVLPMQSEAVLAGLIAADAAALWLLLAVATAGNVLGACVNWWLGLQAERFRDRKWFPLNAAQLQRAQESYRRWGRWSLLLSWVPVIGDALTVMAGVMRERFVVFVGLVTLAKFGRYLAVAAGVAGLQKLL